MLHAYGEETDTNFMVFGLTRSGLEYTNYRSRTITLPMRLIFEIGVLNNPVKLATLGTQEM